MPTGTIILLGAFAGLTIYLGLPLAFFKRAPQLLKAFLSMVATGVLVFLLYDVVGKASEPINDLIDQVHSHNTGGASLILDVVLMLLGLIIGLMGLVYFNKFVIGRLKWTRSQAATGRTPVPTSQIALASVGANELEASDQAGKGKSKVAVAEPVTSVAAPAPSRDLAPATLSLIIAIGIGFHNFSEGLAIGQSAAAGALQLATILIIGFGLHNMTEGFGIAGPLTGQRVSWKFIAMLGLIGGGPTFLGTIFGIAFHSTEVFIFCLALAAGAIIYVVAELFGVAKKVRAPEIVMWGLLLGFFLGYLTDLIVTYAGA
ncbi:ZIP family metal transporter [Dictyobacter aurantiacus]|uniref:Zinc permease n=1 Tax=Dictyobacter aurantiacus TaxID=1936993 RepID=A0A401ZBQ9_9CHLR|nr:ZIP family metal transporter [Dictyobacter aurantiacus]GCE04341.1 hypothetical protein KDAU_16700 [Dictyobacter aurantiacus]